MTPYFEEGGVTIFHGNALDVLRQLPEASVNCCVSSPPYWNMRDYGTAEWQGGAPDCDHLMLRGSQGETGQRAGRSHTQRVPFKDKCGYCGGVRIDRQLGLEKTPEEFVENIVAVFREVKRVLRDDGTAWVNIGDGYNNREGQRKQGVERDDVAGWKQQTNTGSTNVGSRNCPNLKPKDLVGVPWMLAFALRADGWWLRQEIIWHKPNPMPESVDDRPTKAHEQIFLLSKSERYFYDADAIKEPASKETHARYQRGRSDTHKWADGGPGNQTIAKSFAHMRKNGVHPKAAEPGSGIKSNTSFSAAVKDVVEDRNKRSVWTVASYPFPEAHFATFPPALITPCVLAGCPVGGTVLDPFSGAGTTALVAKKNGRKCIGVELNASYIDISARRLSQSVFDFEALQSGI